jgi:beta-galactosidase GanA
MNMKTTLQQRLLVQGLFLLFCLRVCAQDPSSAIPLPHLEKRGNAIQLIVDGKPFLILGGELHNSSASSLAYMKPIWPRLAGMNLNTVLTPVSWELIEPEEGKFDFTTVDGLIVDARKNNLRLVFLWFGSWKNTYSSYAPVWVKRNAERFPRVLTSDGMGTERVSPFADENQLADARAFAALMRHIKQIDGDVHTVIMVQVENEVGVIPEARDHSAIADKAFNGTVPTELLSYLGQHKATLGPEFRAIWDAAGNKGSGTWEEVFGKGPLTEDLFMAWHYARYINSVTAAGKKEYALPMFANAALIRPNYQPGQYNSGGPLPHSLDLWRAGAPAVDFFSPDVYFEDFAEWSQRYRRDGNPLFVPEAIGGAIGAANAFYAIGQLHAIGFSPFGIDGSQSVNPREKTDEANAALTASYAILGQLADLVLKKQSESKIATVLLEGESQRAGRVSLGSYTFTAERASAADSGKRGAAMFLQVGPEEYLVCGSGNLTITISASSDSPGPAIAGIASIDEEVLEEGHWSRRRRLNGDENGQGRVLRLETPAAPVILRVKLYRYR